MLSAHAARNPTKPVQQPRRRTESQATKASRALAAEQRADNDLALTAAFNEIFTQREEDIKTLAKEYSKTEVYICQVLENSTKYTGKRALSLKNAITHRLSKEARDKGEMYNAHDEEINLSGEKYRAYRDSLTEEEKKSLLDDLAESKNTKEHGIRAKNKAVALDAMQTPAQVGKVIIALHSRTAARGFAMFTHGHPDDSAMPCFVESDMASKFFEDTFDCSVWDVVRKFELWSCNRNKTNNRNDIDAVRKQITELVEDALRKITGDKAVSMSWTNYKIDIIHTLGVEMAGWPSSVVMVRPSKMAADAARRILDKLRSGAIHWAALTRSQRAEVAEEVEALRESGAVKQRKQRSDKNKPRRPCTKKSDKTSDPNTSEDDSEEEPMPAPAPRVPTTSALAPRVPTTPVSAPRADNHPASAPRADKHPASAPRAPNDPTPTPHVPTAPASTPRSPNHPASAPHVPTDPAPTHSPRAHRPRVRSPCRRHLHLYIFGDIGCLERVLSSHRPLQPGHDARRIAARNFNFDFEGMDFGPMPLFPSSTSTLQLGLSTDELINADMTLRISTSNREDFVFDGGFNGGGGLSAGTTGYMGTTENRFPGTFIPAVPRAAPGPEAFMSVFSVATNTVTQKRKWAEGDGVEKPPHKTRARS
ncbi:hypothetical protein B0H14DRAFT_3483723 [Mycena olivaceomarginata]|nr:hypothetical protein B0H14DRAFT_3483723 [Mycena olivaceomarginata]